MNIAVRYFTKSGNTEKLAMTIASVANVKAETVEVPITEATDILFLGSSVYAAGVDENVKQFIKMLDQNKVKQVVNFSTAALLPSTYKQVKKLLAEKNITLRDEEFHCRGSFSVMHKGKPDSKDLKDVASFTKKIIEMEKK